MHDPEFERRVADALLASPPASARARAAVMDRVRALPASERPSRRARFGIRVRHSFVGAALAAGIGSVATLSPLASSARHDMPAALATAVIGDSVSATLRDTLRLVRLMFDDTAARRVAAVGDWNGWRADSTPMVRDSVTRRWSATVALQDGAHRYAFVVDGTRWAIDPSAPRAADADGRLYSLLNVAAVSN